MTTRRWPMLLGLVLSLGALQLGLSTGVTTVESWLLAARWTARVGFPVFIIAYSASSLLRLWPGTLTKALVRDRRWWGLGFAASHTVHLYALLTYLKVSGDTRPVAVLIVAGGAYVMMFLMALTSNQAAMRALGANWKRLHTLGIHWLWLVFFASYAGRIMKPESHMTGLIGTTIVLLALGLRIAAWIKSRNRKTATT